jgi:hypothetical protein
VCVAYNLYAGLHRDIERNPTWKMLRIRRVAAAKIQNSRISAMGCEECMEVLSHDLASELSPNREQIKETLHTVVASVSR